MLVPLGAETVCARSGALQVGPGCKYYEFPEVHKGSKIVLLSLTNVAMMFLPSGLGVQALHCGMAIFIASQL